MLGYVHFIFCLLISFVCTAQQNAKTVDSLFNQLEKTSGSEKAEIYRTIGDYASEVSDYESALDYHQKALELFISVNDRQGERNTLLSISSDYSKMGYFDKSLNYVNELMAKAKQTNDARNLAGAYNNKALIELYQDQKDSAMASLKQAYSYAEKISDTLFIKIAIVNNLALFHSQKHEFALAEVYFHHALKLSQKTKNLYSGAGVYLNIANLLLSQEKYNDAMDTVKLALEISSREKYLDIQLPATHLVSEIYESTGKKDSALLYLRMCMPLQDSLKSRQSNESIRKAEIRNAIKEKEHENQLLLKNNEIKSLQIINQQQWLYSLGAGLSIVSVLFVIMYFQYRTQQNTNKSLVKRNLEIIQSENQLREAHEKLQAHINNAAEPTKKSSPVILQIDQKRKSQMHWFSLWKKKRYILAPN